MIILTTVTLASSNNALIDDAERTETCRSCFKVNFNVNFKIAFKKIHLCVNWLKIKKNFDNINMHDICVEKKNVISKFTFHNSRELPSHFKRRVVFGDLYKQLVTKRTSHTKYQKSKLGFLHELGRI